MYLYTNKKLSKIIDVKYFNANLEKSMGDKAEDYRKALEKKFKEKVIAWTDMGCDNETLDLPYDLPFEVVNLLTERD